MKKERSDLEPLKEWMKLKSNNSNIYSLSQRGFIIEVLSLFKLGKLNSNF